MGEFLNWVRTTLGLAPRVPEEIAPDHQAVIDRLDEQQIRLAALDATIRPPEPRRRSASRGFRL